ncbi:carboxylate/amino acid/amine transporter [Balneolaceae bacterium ANBcel3]|nr:carboxylate/amino acid/amine transporter [Balneolaceae bacterium ANBcel3]
MRYLVLVTCIWAFSFSLIDEYLAGQVDSYFAVLSRVIIAGLVMLPFTRISGVSKELIRGMLYVGALQFGITYLCLYQSFRFLSAPEVLLFTILTPIFVTLFDDALNRRFNSRAAIAAMLAVIGAGVIRYDGITGGYMLGFVLMQIANASFAAGQVGYKNLVAWYPTEVPPFRFFGYFYAGAIAVILPGYLLFGDLSAWPSTQTHWLVLLWLGLGASAAGTFLWNHGATKVDAGTLAVMNNAVIPVGLLVNILIWNRDADLIRLGLGALIIGLALMVNRQGQKNR